MGRRAADGLSVCRHPNRQNKKERNVGRNMTPLMDRLFISIGLDPKEIKNSPLRGALYIGIIYVCGLTSAFLIMAVFH